MNLEQLVAQMKSAQIEENTAETKEKAKYWLNFGIKDGDNFVTLFGTPIDTFGSNEKFKPSKDAVAIMEEFHKVAKTLSAGEKSTQELAGGFALQIVALGGDSTRLSNAEAIKGNINALFKKQQ